jgi:hypothetical protein
MIAVDIIEYTPRTYCGVTHRRYIVSLRFSYYELLHRN